MEEKIMLLLSSFLICKILNEEDDRSRNKMLRQRKIHSNGNMQFYLFFGLFIFQGEKLTIKVKKSKVL